LGSNHSTIPTYFNGFISELFCFQYVLNDEELFNIHSYLNNKWNLYASKLEIVGNFEDIEMFDTFTFQVRALKENDEVDTEYNQNITISLIDGSGVLSGTTTKQAVNGVAEFTLTYDTIEKIRIKASAVNLSSATYVFDVNTDINKLTDEDKNKLEIFIRLSGALVLNQTVLLGGVNNDANTKRIKLALALAK
jgi:hypothetical protein